jgi:hypothetical protein
MDQVKKVLEVTKKHHFWVLSGVVALAAIALWWSASSNMAGQIESRRGELTSENDQVKDIRNRKNHPNQKVLDLIKQEHKRLRGEVYGAWTGYYKLQKERNKWPRLLGPDFLDVIAELGRDEDIPELQRETYQNYIQDHFKTLCEIIDIRLPPELDENGQPVLDDKGRPVKIYPFDKRPGQTGGYGVAGGYANEGYEEEGAGYGPGYGETARSTRAQLVGKVLWDSTSLEQMRRAFYWPTTPSTVAVRFAQEDLWVYEALLRIIRDTNEGATIYYNTPVKRIRALEIGKAAAAAFGKSYGQTYGTGGGGYGGGYEGEGYGGGYEEEGYGGGYGEEGYGGGYGEEGYGDGYDENAYDEDAVDSGAAAGALTDADASPEDRERTKLVDYRYVDPNGKPLTATESMESPPFAEFQMIPVRFLLEIDQRKIPKFLVSCVNSDLPMVVRRWRINPGRGAVLNLSIIAGPTGEGDAGESYEETDYGAGEGYEEGYGGGGYGGGGYGGGGYGGGGYGGYGDTADSYEGYGGQGSRTVEDSDTYDVTLEVLGTVYLFNFPDPETFGTGVGTEEPVVVPAGVPGPGPVVVPPPPPKAPPPGAPKPPSTGTPPAAPPGGPTGPPGKTTPTPKAPATPPGLAPAPPGKATPTPKAPAPPPGPGTVNP